MSILLRPSSQAFFLTVPPRSISPQFASPVNLVIRRHAKRRVTNAPWSLPSNSQSPCSSSATSAPSPSTPPFTAPGEKLGLGSPNQPSPKPRPLTGALLRQWRRLYCLNSTRAHDSPIRLHATTPYWGNLSVHSHTVPSSHQRGPEGARAPIYALTDHWPSKKRLPSPISRPAPWPSWIIPGWSISVQVGQGLPNRLRAPLRGGKPGLRFIVLSRNSWVAPRTSRPKRVIFFASSPCRSLYSSSFLNYRSTFLLP